MKADWIMSEMFQIVRCKTFNAKQRDVYSHSPTPPISVFSPNDRVWGEFKVPSLSMNLHWLVVQHRCSHQPKNNKNSFSHLATLKQNLAPKNLQGCPILTFHLLWCQWSSWPIRCWKLPLDLPGLRHKDKWFYQIKCFLMAGREAKCGSFTGGHMCISLVIIPNEAHL